MRLLLAALLALLSLSAAAAELVVQRAGQAARVLDTAELARIEGFTQSLPAPGSAHGMAENAWSGPRLWDVLAAAGAVDPARHGEHVRLVAKVTGQDGYVAVIAIGEVSPEFAARAVQLADHRDGRMLDRPRLVVPGERRAGRWVRDVVRIDVE